jgi:hypothetical protein
MLARVSPNGLATAEDLNFRQKPGAHSDLFLPAKRALMIFTRLT